MHPQENVDPRLVTQRLFALSKQNRFNLQVNNLAQAQALVSDLLGLTDQSAFHDRGLEAEVDSLVERARDGGYTVLREYDESSNKLSYLEIVARGASRSVKKLEPIPYQELRNRLDAVESSQQGGLNQSLTEYKDQRLALGYFKGRNPMKMKEPAYGTGKRLIISLGDAGLGHLQRAQTIISQAANAGWAITAFDFLSEKEEFLGALKRTVDSNRRSLDLVVQNNPGIDTADFHTGSIGFLGALKTADDWHSVVFAGDMEMKPFAQVMATLSAFMRLVYPASAAHPDWLDVYSSLDHVLGLLDEPKAKLHRNALQHAIYQLLGVEHMDEITFEQAETYRLFWNKWVSPFSDLVSDHYKKSNQCNLEVQEVIQSRRIAYTGVSMDFTGKYGVYNRVYHQYLKEYAKGIVQAEDQALVVIRVSGTGLQHSIVMDMTRLFMSKGYQVLLIIDGQTQRAAMIAQKLALVGKAECLWHVCHIKESAAMPINLSKATAGQCLFVNKEKMKEPVMLLPPVLG